MPLLTANWLICLSDFDFCSLPLLLGQTLATKSRSSMSSMRRTTSTRQSFSRHQVSYLFFTNFVWWWWWRWWWWCLYTEVEKIVSFSLISRSIVFSNLFFFGFIFSSSDEILQTLVYKIVPGLFKKEVERRQQFLKEHSDSCKPFFLNSFY